MLLLSPVADRIDEALAARGESGGRLALSYLVGAVAVPRWPRHLFFNGERRTRDTLLVTS